MNKLGFNLPADLLGICISFSAIAEGEVTKHNRHDHEAKQPMTAENSHGSEHKIDAKHSEHGEENGLHISPEQQLIAGIVTKQITSQSLPVVIHAPPKWGPIHPDLGRSINIFSVRMTLKNMSQSP